jgi:Holliday junction resolvase RusA-like endonuclease
LKQENILTFEIFYPINPPGLNQTYAVHNNTFYKRPDVKQYQVEMALCIGAKANKENWEDKYKWYYLDLTFYNKKMDADAPIKLVQDTVFKKLGLNDYKIIDVCSHRRTDKKEGIDIKLYGVIE